MDKSELSEKSKLSILLSLMSVVKLGGNETFSWIILAEKLVKCVQLHSIKLLDSFTNWHPESMKLMLVSLKYPQE